MTYFDLAKADTVAWPIFYPVGCVMDVGFLQITESTHHPIHQRQCNTTLMFVTCPKNSICVMSAQVSRVDFFFFHGCA
jgi:hypothetical protein